MVRVCLTQKRAYVSVDNEMVCIAREMCKLWGLVGARASTEMWVCGHHVVVPTATILMHIYKIFFPTFL